MPIKVLVADDSEIVRRGIRDLLRSHPEIELVGEAADFRETIKMMNELTTKAADCKRPSLTVAGHDQLVLGNDQGLQCFGSELISPRLR
jgi:DNA-binding NarL/FixJ family response regulator